MLAAWAARTSGQQVSTTMPGATLVLQETCSFGIHRMESSGCRRPIFTWHCRQLPTTDRLGW